MPSEELIFNRDTWDYTMNAALNPVLKLGSATLTFNTGLQFTVRRDKEAPFELNQNLFRQFAYMSSNAMGNWLTVQGEAFHEAGPFTDQNLHSREIGRAPAIHRGTSLGTHPVHHRLRHARPALPPAIREFYSTTTSAGVQHEFSDSLRVAVLGEYIRSWRVQDLNYWIAQAMRPCGTDRMETIAPMDRERRVCILAR